MTHIEITGTIVPDEDQHFYDFLGYPASSPRKVSQALKEAGGDEVLILINSYGGDVFSASAIYDALRSYEGALTIRVTGLAASAASVIAMAGRREMAPTALMMIHNAWSYATGDYRDMQKASEDLEKISQGMTLAYMDKSGKSEEEVREIMDHETWYTAAQAVAEGFADKVAEYEKQKTQAAAYIGQGLTDSTRQKIDALIGQADKPQGGTDKGNTAQKTSKDSFHRSDCRITEIVYGSLSLLHQRSNTIRPPGRACQPERGLPKQTAYSVLRSVFADLGIGSFDI